MIRKETQERCYISIMQCLYNNEGEIHTKIQPSIVIQKEKILHFSSKTHSIDNFKINTNNAKKRNLGVHMNSTTINCILFVVITYLLTCIVAWSVPPQYVTLLATFIPASVAILLTVYNKQKIRDLFKLSSLKNCLLGFIMPMVAVMLSNCLFSPIVEYTFTLEKVKDSSIAMILFSLLVNFAILIVTSLGEEVGWRGYLLKNLRSQIPNFYTRAIVVGFIWLIWHIPLYKAMGTLFWEDGFTFPVICACIPYFCIFSIVLTWLFEKDNSVWPVTIAHATSNFFTHTFLVLFTTVSFPLPNHVSVIDHILLAIAYFVVAMGVIWFDRTRGRRLSNS